MSKITLYTKQADISSVGRNLIKYSVGADQTDMVVYGTLESEIEVTVEADASDFVPEFTADEILNAMDYSDIIDWVTKQKELEE